MNRHEIINTIGVEFLSYNIKNQEFSYEKALKKQGKNYKDYLIPGSKKDNKNIDLRFVDGRQHNRQHLLSTLSNFKIISN